MAKFTFELEEILGIRKFEQKQAEADLAQALAEENKINDNLNTIALQYTNSKAQIKGSLNFEDVMAHNQYVKLLDYQKEVLLEDLAKAKLISDEKRKVLAECMKKTTALEKMKEMQFEDFKQEQKLKQKKQLEELASIKSNSDSLN